MVSLVLLAPAPPAVAGSALPTGDPQRGKDLFALAAGCGCHTPDGGPIGAGGGEVKTPFGTFYAPNITPHRQSGIGSWSDAEIAAAIRDGDTPSHGVEAPVMPYYRYGGMSDGDVADLVAYLRSLPPSDKENQRHTGELPLARFSYRLWRLAFAPRPARSAEAPQDGIERGRYIVDHLAICGDCHTPRGRFGDPVAAMYLAGTKQGPNGKSVPNITSHRTGIADWDEVDVFGLLLKGRKPDFDSVQGLMADVVDGHGGGPGYKMAPQADLRAIAAYVKSIAPIDNNVSGK